LASIRSIDLIACPIYLNGIIFNGNAFSKSIELISKKKVEVSKMITHKFGLNHGNKAFEKVISGEANKVIIQCIN